MHQKYVQGERLWYPSHYMHYIALNNIFSAIFDHIMPFNDPFIEIYSEWLESTFPSITIYLLIDQICNYLGIELPEWIKWRLNWSLIDDGDELLINYMRWYWNILEINRLEQNIIFGFILLSNILISRLI